MLRKKRDSQAAHRKLTSDEPWQAVFETWARGRLASSGLGAGRIALALQRWEPEAGLVRQQEREAAVRAAGAAWCAVFGDVAMDPGLIRRGDGPRTANGVVPGEGDGRAWWAGSLSHSGPAGAAVAGVLRLPARYRKTASKQDPTPPIALGVDIEPISRKLHPRMEGKLRPRPGSEAPGVTRIPLLAQWCVKEAIYKADQDQQGRIIADYDWVQVRKMRGQAEGWQGWARHHQEDGPRFAIAVKRVGNCWVALALGFSDPQGRD